MNFLDLNALTREEIDLVLSRAEEFVNAPDQRSLLRGVSVVNLFFEPSTRTYTSFSIAEQRVGADIVHLPPGNSSLGKGETVADTAITLSAMGVRVIVTRHPESGFPVRLGEVFEGQVVNAGDGSHAHPTQALLDLLIIRKEFGQIKGLHVALVGDLLYSRVARSNVIGLRKLGAEVTLIGPPTLLPEIFARDGVRVARDLNEVLPTVDALILLRIQRERTTSAAVSTSADYARKYRMDLQRLALLRSHAIVMHPGPYNRGVELTDDVLRFHRWRYADQVFHGVPVRMAVLDYMINGARTLA
ncbi:MAG TPA: aspartate carbamoyltransferase catalytic subunit [Candidatus Baltobacteraceae bacterium]|nr:aspartate carbamoyltransferase catalytic subunit [Candidatus Baltobacteraceae bacterium]